MKLIPALAILGVLVLAASCGDGSRGEAASSVQGAPRSIRVTSSAFAHEGNIPKTYTGDGEDRSPPLAWSGVPEGAKEIAIVCDDPDAPGDAPWVHWVLHGIPAGSIELAEGAATGIRGKNDFGNLGYGGPAPPAGRVHHYRFQVYALDRPLGLGEGVTKPELLNAMAGRVLAWGELVGTYERQ